jgi:hypothetical protein
MRPEWLHRDVLIAPVTEADRSSVRAAQRIMGLDETGCMDGPTKARLRGFQGLFGLPQTGVLDIATAYILEGIRSHHG